MVSDLMISILRFMYPSHNSLYKFMHSKQVSR